MITNLGLILTLCPVLLLLFRKYREHYVWRYFTEKVDLTDKVYLVTGANSGIGKEVTRELLKRNATVIMACRNQDKTKQVILEFNKSVRTGQIISMELDLASLASVRNFTSEVLNKFERIDCLINNAGLAVPKFETTEDGFEINMGVNHFGHFLLTNLLLDKLKKSAPSRIVVVSSGLHESAKLDFNAIENVSEKTFPKSPRAGYASSKLANMYFALELTEKLQNTGVNVYSCCPGFCYTDVFRYNEIKWYFYILGLPIMYFYMRSANQGANNVLFCAVSQKIKNESGKYYRNCIEWKSKHNFKSDVQKQLWKLSEKMVHLN